MLDFKPKYAFKQLRRKDPHIYFKFHPLLKKTNTGPRSYKQANVWPLQGSCRFLFPLCQTPWHTSCGTHIIFIPSI